MKSLQKAGGVSALIAASTYLFAMALVVTVLSPMADFSLRVDEYAAFMAENKPLVFVWHSLMYLVNGVCLVVLALALHERLKPAAPRAAAVATVFGLFWAVLVISSGLITNYGTEAVLILYRASPEKAETLKVMLETVTLGLDSSDRFLGCLWVGIVSVMSFRTRTLPAAPSVLGISISLAGLVGTVFPTFLSVAYIFGLGVIVWWIWAGILMLRGTAVATKVSATSAHEEALQ